jgi:hypothetical protein
MGHPSTLGERQARPAARPARLIAGDYVGQRAGEAAQAVRCAGLKPGLDRCFGHPAELVGQVVEQHPEPGAELARNDLVTLYVAAPSPTTVREMPAAEHVSERVEPGEREVSQARVRRRRKRRPVDAPHRAAPVAVELAEAPAIAGDGPWEETPLEEFVVQAEEVFAGRNTRIGRPWRRAYPHTGMRERLAAQRRLVRVGVVTLAVLAVVTVAMTRVHTPGARQAGTVTRSGPRIAVAAPKPERTASRAAAVEGRPRSAAPRLADDKHGTPPRRSDADPPPTRVAPAVSASARPPLTSGRAAAVPTRSGGLFSP